MGTVPWTVVGGVFRERSQAVPLAVDEINGLCPSEKVVSPGHVLVTLILDTLPGRSPPLRLERSRV